MDLEAQKTLVINALEDIKGQDITSLDVRELTDITDIMVFCSGTSNRHVKSLAQNVMDESKKNGLVLIGAEGMDLGEWVLVDLGDIVVHVMLPKIREFYQIEKLWDLKPKENVTQV